MKYSGRVSPPAPVADSPSSGTIHAVFFISGVAAVLYQLIWQRVLCGFFGSDIESATIVVTAFMLGLGLGSLAGGALSKSARLSLPLLFAIAEAGIGSFGLLSLPFFAWTGGWAATIDRFGMLWVTLGLLLIPTLLMGATLPILVAHAVRRSANVGRSVASLYFINTLGSAAGAIAVALVIAGALGQRGTVTAAAILNLLAAAIILPASLPRRAAP